MALYYPDNLEHNNPNLPLLDDSQLDGGFRVVADVTARNAVPVGKRKIGALMAWAVSGTWYRMQYIGADLTDTEWQKDTNWVNLAVYNEAETVSRTIYVTATGNDTTGDGLVGNPYLTIGKALSTVKKVINSGVTITISVGAGTFTLTISDLSIISAISGSGGLLFIGTLALVDSGFTMGAAEALDPLTYAVSGGNTATWTLDQWKYYFLKSGSNYNPITNNALTPSISVSIAGTGTEIYQTSTILNLTLAAATSFIYNINSLSFEKLNLNIAGNFALIISGESINFTNCYLIRPLQLVSFLIKYEIEFSRCSFNGFIVRSQLGLITLFNGNYFYGSYTNALFFVSGINTTIQSFNNNVFENPNSGINARALSILQASVNNSTTSNNNVKFQNCFTCLNFNDGSLMALSPTGFKVILKNTSYLFRKASTVSDYSNFKVFMYYNNIIGTPLIRWFFDPMYEFVNALTGRNIQITGLIYPEFQQNLSATLTNNTTTNVIVGNKLQNRSIHIQYTLTRGTGYRTGQFDIISDGTNVFMSPDVFIDNGVAGVGDPAVVFAVDLNTNEIRINAVVDNSGGNVTMQYDVTRKMIVPLSI